MWQALGEMSKEEVQKRFAQLMDSSSEHSFLAWVGQKVKEEEEERRWDMTLSGSTLFWFTLCLYPKYDTAISHWLFSLELFSNHI